MFWTVYHAFKAFLTLPLFGGYGPELLALAYVLGCIAWLNIYETRLTRKIGSWLAARKVAPMGAACFALLMAASWFYVAVR